MLNNCHICPCDNGSGYLGDAQLASSQLPLGLVQLLAALCLSALQLFAALHHGLHLRLHLTDVETGHGELLVNHTAALLLLWGWKKCEVALKQVFSVF